MTDALGELIGVLRCPVCRQSMQLAGRTVICPDRHTFDIARQGYLNLLGRAAPDNADSAAMVQARRRFLDSGAYRVLVELISAQASGSGLMIDCGGGPGWYAAELLNSSATTWALSTDISPAAARLAAKAHQRLAAIVADSWGLLPIGDAVADHLVCLFAPRNIDEFARVLRPGGLLSVAFPGPDHLRELRERHQLLGIHAGKTERLLSELAPGFEVIAHEQVDHRSSFGPDQVSDLINMGPNAFHGPVTVTEAERVSIQVELVIARRLG